MDGAERCQDGLTRLRGSSARASPFAAACAATHGLKASEGSKPTHLRLGAGGGGEPIDGRREPTGINALGGQCTVTLSTGELKHGTVGGKRYAIARIPTGIRSVSNPLFYAPRARASRPSKVVVIMAFMLAVCIVSHDLGLSKDKITADLLAIDSGFSPLL
jgi:hypothetical protein